MKKIVPFNNVLDFNTDVKEITAISLEHEIIKAPDMVSGVFYISGEYKITDGQLDKEKFNFELPFDIALSCNYNIDTLLVDIDDFRYNLISDKSLKVNIDLYIDGEIVEEPIDRNAIISELPINDIDTFKDDILKTIKDSDVDEDYLLDDECEDINEVDDNEDVLDENSVLIEEDKNLDVLGILDEPNRIDLLKDMLNNDSKEDTMKDNINIDIDNEQENKNVNSNENIIVNEEDEYVTYRVYKVSEGDTIDSILAKYNITKEMLSDYNNIENIVPGDKLIIPTNEK